MKSDSYYAAKKALELIEIEWIVSEIGNHFSSRSTKSGNGLSLFQNALPPENITKTNNSLSTEYWAPYLAHAIMEPMNCTVKIEDEYLTVWTGSQNPELVAGVAAFYSDIPKEKVIVHSQFMGGRFLQARRCRLCIGSCSNRNSGTLWRNYFK